MSFSLCMDKQAVACLHNKIFFRHEEWIADTFNNIDESQIHSANWKQQDSQGEAAWFQPATGRKRQNHRNRNQSVVSRDRGSVVYKGTQGNLVGVAMEPICILMVVVVIQLWIYQISLNCTPKGKFHFILKMYLNKFRYSEVMGILCLGIPKEGPSPELLSEGATQFRRTVCNSRKQAKGAPW